MIYCVGLRLKYDKAFAAGPVIKRGRGVDSDGRSYPGGWVWQSADDARRFIDAKGLFATHEVYGVIADWERDAEWADGEGGGRLIRDAEVVRLPYRT